MPRSVITWRWSATVGIAVVLAAAATLALAALAGTTTTWTLVQTTPFSGATGLDAFGFAVAVSPDGGTALVGAPEHGGNRGAVAFYSRANGRWVHRQTIGNPGGTAQDEFGSAVAVAANASTAVVGAPYGPGFAAIFVRSGVKWTLRQSIPNPAHVNTFGTAVAISADGATIVIKGPSDNVLVYGRIGSTWTLRATISDPDGTGSGFGDALALSARGDAVLVGDATAQGGSANPYDPAGIAWLFARHGTAWTPRAPRLNGGVAGANFGAAVALSPDGATAVVGAPGVHHGMGAVRISVLRGAGWGRQQTITEPGSPNPVSPYGAQFGSAVATSAGAGSVIVGLPLVHLWGAVATFERLGSRWIRTHTISAPGPGAKGTFGGAVASAVDGTTLVVGAPGALKGSGSISMYTVPALRVRWTIDRDFVTALISPRPGAARYSLRATNAAGVVRVGVCRWVGAGVGRRVRCTRSLSVGVWTLTAQAHSSTSVIAQAVRTSYVH